MKKAFLLQIWCGYGGIPVSDRAEFVSVSFC